jgi:hypothetical protein
MTRSAAAAQKIRIYLGLPLDLQKQKASAWMNVLPEDKDAIALKIASDHYEPTFTNGDLLMMRPLQLALDGALQSGAVRSEVANLNSRHVVAVANGDTVLGRVQVEPEKACYRAQLHALGSRRVIRSSPENPVVVQAVVYKCVRPY